MYLIPLIIILCIVIYLFKFMNNEKFTINSKYNSNLDLILNTDKKEIIYNNVIPSEYKTYILKILIYIFENIDNYTKGKIRFIPYEIIEIFSECNIIQVYFFANSPSEFNSLVFKADFELSGSKLRFLNLKVRDSNKKTFNSLYPNQNIDKIDLDSVSGVIDDTLAQNMKINYRVNPIINPNFLRKHILPKFNTNDTYIPGMFRTHTSQNSMFSKLYTIPQLSFI